MISCQIPSLLAEVLILIRIPSFFDPHIFWVLTAHQRTGPASGLMLFCTMWLPFGLLLRPLSKTMLEVKETLCSWDFATKIDADEMGMDCYHCESIGIHRVLLQYITMIIAKMDLLSYFQLFFII